MADEREVCSQIIEQIKTGHKCLDISSLDSKLDKIPEDVFKQLSSAELLNIIEFKQDFNDFLSFPDNIGSLKALVKVSAEGNEITTFPSSFTELSWLEELRLDENRIKELPKTFCNFKCLRKLSLVANELKKIPGEIIEGLIALEELYLDENNVAMLPDNFGKLKSLRILELSENNLITLPNSFGQLTSLEVLNLSRNKLDELPESFGELQRLENIDLTDNNLSYLPEKFASAEIIKKLYLDNNVIGCLPEWFGNLTNIICLTLNDNKLQNNAFPETFPISSKTTLRKLEAGGNSIVQLPTLIGELEHLEELHLGSTICELERRNFQNGNWIRSLPESFGSLVSISKLRLDENQIISLPECFGQLIKLTRLDLAQNLLSTLPNSFCDLELLEYCHLSKNKLIHLPENFGKLSKLIDLRLDQNLLQELPVSCVELQSLHTLDLFNNQLREIPTWLPKLTSLKRLDLDGNKMKLKLKDIPHIVSEGLKYAERDPALKDNWRGKARRDMYLETEIMGEIGDDENEVEDENEFVQEGYNERALFVAMRQGLSIWKTHSGPNERQITLEEETFSGQVNFFEDEINEENLAQGNGNFIKLNTNRKSDECEEDWDEEITSLSHNNIMVPSGVVVATKYESEKTNEFLTLLSSYPPASQAYTTTATYKSIITSAKTEKITSNNTFLSLVSIQGQFDDAD